MDRRKFIIGVGALGAGTSAALGTGAFTSVEANRDMTVATAGDRDAYLRLMPSDTPNGNKYASYNDDGTLSVSLDALNENAVTTVEGLFDVQNEGSQPVSVYLSDQSDAVDFETDGRSLEGASKAARLATGESVTVDVTVDTTGGESGQLMSNVTVMAKSQVFTARDDDVVTVGPAGSGADENTLTAGLSTAADESASAVLLKTGRFEEEATISTAGLTVKAEEGASPVLAPSGEPSDGTVLDVEAPDVTVEGLTIENPKHVTSNKNPYPSQAGLSIGTGADGIRIIGNTFQNIGTADDAKGNTQAVSCGGGVSGISIVNNTFSDISAGYFDGEYFDWYTAKAIYLSANPSGQSGSSQPITDVTIRGNDITNVYGPVSAYGIEIHHDTSGVEIAENTISGVKGDVDNEFTDEVKDWGGNYDWASAISLANDTPTGPSDVDIHDNYLSADSYENGDLTPGFGVVLEGLTDAQSVRIRNNDIEAAGGVINKTGRGVVDARQNWWNAADGPASPGSSVVNSAGSAVADGSGAYVVDYDGDGTAEIDFDDYLTEPSESETFTVSADGSADFDHPADALAVASPTDTVEVLAGEYTVTEPLSLPPGTSFIATGDVTLEKVGTGVGGGQGVIVMNGAGEVDGFDIDIGVDGTQPAGIKLQPDSLGEGEIAEIVNNDIERLADNGADAGGNPGISTGQQSDGFVGIAGNTLARAGAIGAGVGTGQGLAIVGNEIDEAYSEGIFTYPHDADAGSLQIESNVVSDPGAGTDGVEEDIKLTEVPASVNETNVSTAVEAAKLAARDNPEADAVLVQDGDGEDHSENVN